MDLLPCDGEKVSHDLGRREAGTSEVPQHRSVMETATILATVTIPMLFAQSPNDPLSGGAGWIGAGLLGLVLCWLMLKHLPDKDKLVKEIVDGHNARVDAMISRQEASMDRQRDAFKHSLEEVLKHCVDEADETRKAFVEELKRAQLLHPPTRRPPS